MDDDRHDTIIVEGDDSEHLLPPSDIDPYTPEPEPRGKARRAMIVALVVVVIMLAIVVIYTVAH